MSQTTVNVANMTEVYRYHSGSNQLFKVQRAVQAISRLGNLDIRAELEGESIVFYAKASIGELDRCHLDKIISSLIQLLGKE